MSLDAHELHMLSADTRCEVAEHDHSAAPLPGDLMYQAICAPCRWHAIDSSENGAVEAWHEHALPGWRALPVLPDKLASALSTQERRSREALTAWISQHYPAEWQRRGAPIRTRRQPNGIRHVPGHSPLGGYDMAVENA